MTQLTSMERHVLELVEHLKNGEDTQRGFYAKIDAARDHARWLENRCRELSDENDKLLRLAAPALPSISASSKFDDAREAYMNSGPYAFEWHMEPIRFRVVDPRHEGYDDKTLRRVKKRAYRGLLRLFRKEFNRTWDLNDRLWKDRRR